MNKSIINMRLFALSFLIAGSLMAQEKLTKVSQSIKVNKDVKIDLNTSYTNIIFDTWNKNTVEIEAYIEGENLSKEDLNNALKSWNVDVDASSGNVSISTKSNAPHVWATSYNNGDNDAVKAVLEELKFELADLPDVDFDFEMPELPEIPELPEMPELPELPEGVHDIHFDYKAYKKYGEKYLEEYTQEFESKYGKDYAKKMEAWGEKFGKEWGEEYGKQMEEWAKKFEGQFDNKEYEKQMEIWGKRFAKQMDQQAKRIELTLKQKALIAKRHEEQAKAHMKHAEQRNKLAQEREKLAKERKVLIEKLVDKKNNIKVKKTIKIKMPKGAKLKVNVRHGELEFASNIDNLKADLSHTKFTAYSVNGGSTSINASYSPIHVTNWNLGELNLKYVKKADFNNVKSMVLTSNSSNVTIDNLIGNAIIDGSIGDLKILKIDNTFTNLNILIQNSDAIITLPKVGYNLQYKGMRSRFSHPEKPLEENMTSFTSSNSNTGKTIVVNAKYSNVEMN